MFGSKAATISARPLLPWTLVSSVDFLGFLLALWTLFAQNVVSRNTSNDKITNVQFILTNCPLYWLYQKVLLLYFLSETLEVDVITFWKTQTKNGTDNQSLTSLPFDIQIPTVTIRISVHLFLHIKHNSHSFNVYTSAWYCTVTCVFWFRVRDSHKTSTKSDWIFLTELDRIVNMDWILNYLFFFQNEWIPNYSFFENE